MKTVGVGVEGPSDFQFWNKILHKHFRGWQFDIRNMKNRDKLVRATPDLIDEFRALKRRAAFILLDRDKDPCNQAVLTCFEPTVVAAARRQPPAARFVHICVAVKKLECWYLADAMAINAVIGGGSWAAPSDTASCNGKSEIAELLRAQSKAPIGYNEIDFAKSIAPKFSPRRAEDHSASFHYLWSRVSGVCST